MRYFVWVVVAFVTVVVSSASSAWQIPELSQSNYTVEQGRQFLNNYPTEPFMNKRRLEDIHRARRANDVVQTNGYNSIRQQATSLERGIKARLSSAREALDAGQLERFGHEMNLLNAQQQRLADLVKRWDQLAPTVQEYTDVSSELDELPDSAETPPGPEVVSNAPPPPTPPTAPTFLGVSLTTPVVVTGVAVAVGTAAAITNNGDETTDTTGGNN